MDPIIFLEMMRQSKIGKKSKAFTLIEISVVILIIGILLAGTFIGTRLIAKSRLAAAESLARSSPVPGIKDNMLWLETSLSASIDSSQASDGAAVTSWYDQSSNAAKPLVVAVGTGPTYANTINHVHAIKFVGSTANYLQISDASFLNGTDYTIMVLEKRQSGGSNNYFIGETSGSPNTSLALGYSSDSTVIHAQGNQSYATSATVSSYASSTDKPRQFTFVHSSTAGNSTYINGILAAQDATKTAHLSGITSLAIGKGYTGEIGEIAIFARALKPEERQPIEDYAGKKWTRSINRSAVSGGSCIGYTITESGCDLSASPCSISVAGLVASVSPTSSSTSIACNQVGYSGSVNYTCINGTANVTGSCTSAPPCSVTPAGVSAAINVSSGSTGSGTCNVAHYTGTASFSCSSGTPTYISQCTCATGYTGSGCSTCDTGYASDGSGGCGLKCSITGVVGITDGTQVNPSSTSVACNASGVSGGPITYTCLGGVFTKTGGTCVVPKCSGGNTSMYTIAGETVHVFTTGGTLTCNQTTNAQVLIVAGGGGAGGNIGGGGGAGGLIYQASQSLSNTSYPVVVGAGGTGGGSGVTGTNGGNSSFNSQIALGGGGGGGWGSTPASGGSGGGSGGSGAGATGQSGQGTSGGGPGSGFIGGGGGGAGHAGYNGNSIGGNGGEGLSYNISGSSIFYAAGGGAGTVNAGNNSGGTGGSSIGGNGGSANQVATSGATNTGSGGGGGGNIGSRTGGNGGSGIVIIRYVN